MYILVIWCILITIIVIWALLTLDKQKKINASLSDKNDILETMLERIETTVKVQKARINRYEIIISTLRTKLSTLKGVIAEKSEIEKSANNPVLNANLMSALSSIKSEKRVFVIKMLLDAEDDNNVILRIKKMVKSRFYKNKSNNSSANSNNSEYQD